MCDLRGFGLSSGERIKIDSVNMTRDVAVMLNEIPKGSTPLYLLGHSMGSLILETFAQLNGPFMDSNVAGMFYTAPFFGLHEHHLIHIPRYKRILTKLFAGPIVYEGAVVNVGKRYDWLSSNSAFRRQMMKSTNNQTMPFVTYESWFKLLAGQDQVVNNAGHYHKVPVLMHLSSKDKLVDSKIAKTVHAEIKKSNKQSEMKLYPDAYHFPFKDDGVSTKYLTSIFEWMKKGKKVEWKGAQLNALVVGKVSTPVKKGTVLKFLKKMIIIRIVSMLIYAFLGLCVYVLARLTSKDPLSYNAKYVILKWPLAYIKAIRRGINTLRI